MQDNEEEKKEEVFFRFVAPRLIAPSVNSSISIVSIQEHPVKTF